MRPLLALILLGGCGEAFAPTDVCEQARDLFERCGASVPLLAGEKCAGLGKAVSRCVVEHATDCDALVTLVHRLDECAPDAGDDFLPALEDLPVAYQPRDAGHPDAGHP
jgi:hypothetical protein